MKNIMLLIVLLLTVGCSSNNSVDDVGIESNNYYCYKEYDKYDEYVSIEYSDDIIVGINYSYVFDDDVDDDKINSLKEYSDYIVYKDKTLELVFDDIYIDSYILLKDKVIDLFGIKKDNYNYVDGDYIKYSLFRDYLDGYSCE